MCAVAGLFVKGHMPVIWNVCIAVLLVALLLSLSSFRIYSEIGVICACEVIDICDI